MKKLIHIFLLFKILMTACVPKSTAVDAPVVAPVDVATEPLDSPFLAIDLTQAERAADLLARMTLEEKIGQMTLVEKDSISGDAVMRYFIGGVLSGGGGAPARNTIERWAKMVDNFQKAALKTRLGIPIIYGVDAIHGHGNLRGAVIFPHNIGLGATGDSDLVRRVAQATAAEMAATNIRWNYAPTISVGQDIRWGRTYEVFSENMDLVTQLGVAYLEGLQGDSLSDYMSVLATSKHYIGDGGTVWGSSTNSSYIIDVGDLQVDEATLRALHFPPYRKGGRSRCEVHNSVVKQLERHKNAWPTVSFD